MPPRPSSRSREYRPETASWRARNSGLTKSVKVCSHCAARRSRCFRPVTATPAIALRHFIGSRVARVDP